MPLTTSSIATFLGVLQTLPPELQRLTNGVPINQLPAPVAKKLTDEGRAAWLELINGDHGSISITDLSSATVMNKQNIRGRILQGAVTIPQILAVAAAYESTGQLPMIEIVRDRFHALQYRVFSAADYEVLLAAEYLGLSYLRVKITEAPEDYDWKCPPPGKIEHTQSLEDLQNVGSHNSALINATESGRASLLKLLLRTWGIDFNEILVVDAKIPIQGLLVDATSPNEYGTRSWFSRNPPIGPAEVAFIIPKRCARMLPQSGANGWEIIEKPNVVLSVNFQNGDIALTRN